MADTKHEEQKADNPFDRYEQERAEAEATAEKEAARSKGHASSAPKTNALNTGENKDTK
jgi:hypothetical protein